MDPQMLQVIKDAATVIQALMDERNAMQQQAMTQQQTPQKTAATVSDIGFSNLVSDDFIVKSAYSDDIDARSKFARDEAYFISLVSN